MCVGSASILYENNVPDPVWTSVEEAVGATKVVQTAARSLAVKIGAPRTMTVPLELLYQQQRTAGPIQV